MTVSKAKFLGRFYFFWVSFLLLIPLSHGLVYVYFVDEIAETWIISETEKDTLTWYDLERVSEEEWILLKQEQRKCLDIVGGSALICSLFFGASPGEDIIINAQSRNDVWKDKGGDMFLFSLLIGVFIWYFSFIIGIYGFNSSILRKVLNRAFINIFISFVAARNLGLYIGAPIIYKLLTLHKN